jgi:putative transposase
MVSPQAKRAGVGYLMTHRKYSQRQACELVRVTRSSARYRSRIKPEEVELRAQIRQLANRHQTYGCPRITALLPREGSPVNHKRVHRLWKLEGLQLPRRKPRKQWRGPKREVVNRAEHYNHVWSYDFLEDRTESGSKLRILTVLDEYTRECLEIRVERSIAATKGIDTLEWLGLVRGLPDYIRSDNGPEFVAKAIQQWLKDNHCQTIYIEPGSPWENPYIESFNGKLRAECLDRYAFANGPEAQEITTGWKEEYNRYRPHSSLGYQTPEEFAASVARPLGLIDNSRLRPKTLTLSGT